MTQPIPQPTPQSTPRPTVRERVEDFLYAEAELLDDWELNKWLGLLTPDARYEVPSTDRRDGRPDTALMLVSDSRPMIDARVKRLSSRKAHREFPWSRTRRIIGNVRVSENADGTLDVGANFAVYRTRSNATHLYVGRYRYRLLPDGDSFRIAFRRAELDQESLDEHGTMSIIL